MKDNALNGYRVLIAEDEYLLANDLERALKTLGANVIGPYSDPHDAYLQAAHDHLDAAIIDINLHNRPAYPVADELIRQHIPFVFYTGYGANVIPKRFAHVERWQKPADASALVDHIGRLCRQSLPRR